MDADYRTIEQFVFPDERMVLDYCGLRTRRFLIWSTITVAAGQTSRSNSIALENRPAILLEHFAATLLALPVVVVAPIAPKSSARRGGPPARMLSESSAFRGEIPKNAASNPQHPQSNPRQTERPGFGFIRTQEGVFVASGRTRPK
jgi:hypothetical protein